MMLNRKKRIGELLKQAGLITDDDLTKALKIQKEEGERLGRVFVKHGFITEFQLMEVLEQQLGITFVDLTSVTISKNIQKIIPYPLIKRYNVVPIKLIEGKKLLVVMEDPLNFIAIDDLRMVTQCEIVPAISYYNSIISTINRLYGHDNADKAIKEIQKDTDYTITAEHTQEQEIEVDSAPIVRLVNSTLELAVSDGASDIHIEPLENVIRVRYRVDGKLYISKSIPKEAHAAVVTRVKVLSGLDIAERRLPQDGRFDYRLRDKVYNVRVSVLPTVHGEKIVMRILDKSSFMLPKEAIGFTQSNMEKFNQLLKNPYGIVLVTGPTGSGKSTTLYAMLNELNETFDNIVTIEDPVEYMIDGLNQVQANPKIGLDFASALRSFLRQDPDIIMVGEIRDAETADIAIRAAITGHLVLSTLHTNDAVSSISRLLDMGIPSYMLAVSLMGIISQRLVRKLCPNCAADYLVPEHEQAYLGLEPGEYYFKRAMGCPICGNTGYKGRIAVHEILLLTKEHRDLIARNASINEITKFSIEQGMSTLKQECVDLLMRGITSFQEVTEITYSQNV